MPYDDHADVVPIEWLDEGRPGGDGDLVQGHDGDRGRGGGALAVCAALVLAVGGAAALHRGDEVVRPDPTPTTAPVVGPAPSINDPRTTHLGRPLLGIGAGWELFARSATEVVRIRPAAGLVTRTPVPAVHSSGPVAFLVGRHEAVVRPLDAVSGFVVADGAGGPSAFVSGGLSVRGPGQDRIWLAGGSVRAPAMDLTDLDGRPTGTSVPLPASGAAVTADGAGGLLVRQPDGVYRTGVDEPGRVTTGFVTAVGPTRLLATECDPQPCASVLIDQGDGSSRRIGGTVGREGSPRGVIAPDGSIAALPVAQARGGAVVHLVDLTDGGDTVLARRLDPTAGEDGLVWSPDGRWLFLVATGGRLVAVERSTGAASDLPLELPALTQLAVRATGS